MSERKREIYREFFGGPMAIIGSDFRDDDGRPIDELLAPADVVDRAASAGIPFKQKPAPYPGSRSGKPMNFSALAQLKAHWTDVLRIQVFLRKEYLRRARRTEITVADLWRLSMASMTWPSYLCRRATTPLGDGAIPSRIASLRKAAIGF